MLANCGPGDAQIAGREEWTEGIPAGSPAGHLPNHRHSIETSGVLATPFSRVINEFPAQLCVSFTGIAPKKHGFLVSFTGQQRRGPRTQPQEPVSVFHSAGSEIGRTPSPIWSTAELTNQPDGEMAIGAEPIVGGPSKVTAQFIERTTQLTSR